MVLIRGCRTALIVLVAMSINACVFPHERYFASDFKGVVLTKGIPVEGAEVTRHISVGWDDTEYYDSTITNKYGEFSFDKKAKYHFIMLPHEPSNYQEYSVVYNQKKHVLLGITKNNYEINGEQITPLNFKCDLLSEEKRRYVEKFGTDINGKTYSSKKYYSGKCEHQT
jgi:hypothetical protein